MGNGTVSLHLDTEEAEPVYGLSFFVAGMWVASLKLPALGRERATKRNYSNRCILHGWSPHLAPSPTSGPLFFGSLRLLRDQRLWKFTLQNTDGRSQGRDWKILITPWPQSSHSNVR
jgi:hypothetical protein